MNRRNSRVGGCVVCIMIAVAACTKTTTKTHDDRVFLFREVWGYLMKGEEAKVTGREPLTDILYFGSSIGRDCRLRGTPRPPELPFSGRPPRVHLVIFLLNDPSLFRACAGDAAARDRLASEIATAASLYAGVQIDVESLDANDRELFTAFVSSVRAKLSEAVLSVAVPAKIDPAARPAYDYAALAAVCDRVFVMAYDQHWETSRPGPVAGLSWCRKVAANAVAAVPRDRLVMGIPLYGRAWPEKKLNRSLTWEQAEHLASRAGGAKRCEEQGAFFSYIEQVRMHVFYEDPVSIRAKLRLYDSYGIPAVAFWRLGQGAPSWWEKAGLDIR